MSEENREALVAAHDRLVTMMGYSKQGRMWLHPNGLSTGGMAGRDLVINERGSQPPVPIKPDGFVRLVAQMGDDRFVVEAARIGRPSDTHWRRTLRYMMRHGHTSPFEFVNFVFHVRLPIFVARQWMRHRACVFNEWSARYMELPDAYWSPDTWRGQAKTNRQGSEGELIYNWLGFVETHPPDHEIPVTDEAGNTIAHTSMRAETAAFQEYGHRLAAGVAREQARSCLPLSTYTEFYWKIDLHNLFNFLRLRDDSHAQREIRDYAEAIDAILAFVVPESHAAWKEFQKDAVRLTTREIEMVKGNVVHFDSESEMRESVEKLRALGLYSLGFIKGDTKPITPEDLKTNPSQ